MQPDRLPPDVSGATAAQPYAAGRHARGHLVDIGCGAKPWSPAFAPYVDRHIGVDHEQTLDGLAAIEVIADAYNAPTRG